MKSWIKGGIVGAIIYPMLNLAFLYGGLACGSDNGNNVFCPAIEWIYFNLFVVEHLEFLIPRSFGQNGWLLILVFVDIAIAFAIGALITEGIRRLRKKG